MKNSCKLSFWTSLSIMAVASLAYVNTSFGDRGIGVPNLTGLSVQEQLTAEKEKINKEIDKESIVNVESAQVIVQVIK